LRPGSQRPAPEWDKPYARRAECILANGRTGALKNRPDWSTAIGFRSKIPAIPDCRRRIWPSARLPKQHTDSAIRAQLSKWIKAKTVPKNTKNTLYFIYLDPGISSIMGGGKSCQNYCAYHNNVGKVYYAVMPYPTCSGCLGGLPAFDALTGTSSHELCEAITDPVPGSGWYDNTNGEIGDICAWNFKKIAGYTVQLEWSNQQNNCV